MSYNFSSLKVLVIDDNVSMTDLVKSVLLAFGVGHVFTASDGQRGYQFYKEIKPDLIITDWMMQPVDGLTLIKMIRNNADSPNPFIPIIMLTGYGVKERVMQARDTGATEFLIKPFKANDLYKRIETVIENPRQYVRAKEFFGPDRRRKQKEVDEVKRTEDELERHAPSQILQQLAEENQ